MRDPSKPIPILGDILTEKVRADITNPETFQAAVRRSRAKTAFIYAIHESPDNMRRTLVALKGGVEFVVLLSSFAVQGDLQAIPPTDIVPYIHTKVGIALEDVFGGRWSAVRPAYFASNVLQYKDEIVRGDVRLPNSDIEFDWVSPEDIGRVVGIIVAHGAQDRYVPLVGPDRLSLKDALGVVGRLIGKEIKVTIIGKEQAVKDMQQKRLPEPAAK